MGGKVSGGVSCNGGSAGADNGLRQPLFTKEKTSHSFSQVGSDAPMGCGGRLVGRAAAGRDGHHAPPKAYSNVVVALATAEEIARGVACVEKVVEIMDSGWRYGDAHNVKPACVAAIDSTNLHAVDNGTDKPDAAAEDDIVEDGGGLGDDEGGHGSDHESEAKLRRVLSEPQAIGDFIQDHGSLMYYEETGVGVHLEYVEKNGVAPLLDIDEDTSRGVVGSVSDPGVYTVRSAAASTRTGLALYSHQEMDADDLAREDDTDAGILLGHEENASVLSRPDDELVATASSDSVVSVGVLTIVPSPKAATDDLGLGWRTRDMGSSSAKDADESVMDSVAGFAEASGFAAVSEVAADTDEIHRVTGPVDDEEAKKYYDSSKDGDTDVPVPIAEQKLEQSSAEGVALAELRSDPGPCRERNESEGSDIMAVDDMVKDTAHSHMNFGDLSPPRGSSEAQVRSAVDWAKPLPAFKNEDVLCAGVSAVPPKGAAAFTFKRRAWWKALFSGMKVLKEKEEQQCTHKQIKEDSPRGGKGGSLQGKEEVAKSKVSPRSDSGGKKKGVGGSWFKWEKPERLVEAPPTAPTVSPLAGSKIATNNKTLERQVPAESVQAVPMRAARSVSAQSAPNLLLLSKEPAAGVLPTTSSALTRSALESKGWSDFGTNEKNAGFNRKTWVMEWLDRLDVSEGAWDVLEEEMKDEDGSESRPSEKGVSGGNTVTEDGDEGKSGWRRSLSLNALTEKNVMDLRTTQATGGADGLGCAKEAAPDMDKMAVTIALPGQAFRVVPPFGSFGNLRNLDLSRNSIAGIPPGCLPKSLHILDLSYNKLSIIEGLRDLSRLQVLKLSFNRLVRVGYGLGNCTSLRELYLSENKISEIEGFHRLLKLTVLDLSGNKLTSMKALGQLAANYKSLQALNLRGNPIVTNVSGEPFRKFIMGLVPHLLYLNQELIKPVPGRDGLNESLAKTVLGPAGYNTQRVSRPRKPHRSSQTPLPTKVYSSSGGSRQTRSASQVADKMVKQNHVSNLKHAHNTSGSGASQSHKSTHHNYPPQQQSSAPPAPNHHQRHHHRYHDMPYYYQLHDGGSDREIREVQHLPKAQSGAVADLASGVTRGIAHARSDGALTSVLGNEDAGNVFLPNYGMPTLSAPSNEEAVQDMMWNKGLYPVGSFNDWNREASGVGGVLGAGAASDANGFQMREVVVPNSLMLNNVMLDGVMTS